MNQRDRIMRGRRIAAHFAATGGPAFLPIFERMEREVAALGATESAMDRARRVLAGM